MGEKAAKQERGFELVQPAKDATGSVQEYKSITKEIEDLESQVKKGKEKIEKIDRVLAGYMEKSEKKERPRKPRASETKSESPDPSPGRFTHITANEGAKIVAKTAIGAGAGILVGVGLIAAAAHAEIWAPILLVKAASA
ncbi:MAG: hypothetical protein AB1742_09515, partial [bacterium]